MPPDHTPEELVAAVIAAALAGDHEAAARLAALAPAAHEGEG